MKKELNHAPHAGAAMLSQASRMPLFEWMVQEDPRAMQKLADHMDTLYNADNAAYILKVSSHPDMQEILEKKTVVARHGIVHWLSHGRSHGRI